MEEKLIFRDSSEVGNTMQEKEWKHFKLKQNHFKPIQTSTKSSQKSKIHTQKMQDSIQTHKNEIDLFWERKGQNASMRER